MSPILVSWTGVVLPVSVGLAVLALAALPFGLVRIPPDYLLRPDARVIEGPGPVPRIVFDALGAVLVLVGLVLLVLPGQGLLAILTGLLFLRFPGKPTVVRKLLGRRSVLRPVNALRRRLGRPEIERARRGSRPGQPAPEHV